MNKEHYRIVANKNHMEFEFYSEGPKGKIKKAIIYTPLNTEGTKYYNLAFGDLNDKTGKIDDLSVSNNADRDKVLATVAKTVLEFTSHFPGAGVYAEGSTPIRTRLYQIAISSNLEAISSYLTVYGLISGKLYLFEKNIRYEAFVVLRK